MIKFWVNFGFIGSTVITMFHQVNYSGIVTIMLKPVGAVLENFENSQFFSQGQFSVRKEPDKGGNFIYPMMHHFILYYQASERT